MTKTESVGGKRGKADKVKGDEESLNIACYLR